MTVHAYMCMGHNESVQLEVGENSLTESINDVSGSAMSCENHSVCHPSCVPQPLPVQFMTRAVGSYQQYQPHAAGDDEYTQKSR